MNKQISKQMLMTELLVWNSFLRRKVHLIACGGTAMTLLNVKSSTKDIDFIVPVEKEYRYLYKFLINAGYKNEFATGLTSNTGIRFDLFEGKLIFTTELLENPLNNNIFMKEWSYLYLGCLNYYDLIISKLFRGTIVDHGDIFVLWQNIYKDMDFNKLEQRYIETAKYDINPEKMMDNFRYFKDKIIEKGYYEEK